MASNNNVQAQVTFKVFNQDFNRAMAEMNASSNKARREMQLAQEQLKANGTETQKLEARLKGLEQQQQIAAEKVRLATEQYERAKATFGENSVEAQRLEQQVLSLAIAEQRLANDVLATSQDMAKHEKAMKDLDNVLALAGGSIDDFASALGDDLTVALKNGTANSSQLERAMTIIGQTALGTGNDVSKLREALRQIDQGVNLEAVRQDLSRLGQEALEAEDDVESLKDTLKGVSGTLAAIVGIGAAVTQAMDVSSLNRKIAITFDVPPESVESVRAATKQIEAYGLDGEEALEAVRRQWALNSEATDEANTKIIKGAGMIAASYNGIDLIELVQETNEVAAALEITNDEALALTNSLLKAGFPPEQLDTIAEYGTQMKLAGFSTAEVQSIFERGIDSKSWNVDNLNDGVKEVRLQVASFGSEVPKALADVLAQTDVGAERFQQWGIAVAKGGEGGAKALSEMVTWLDAMEEGTVKNEIATAVFGTKWEDQGQNLISVFQGLSDAQDKTAQNQEKLNDAIEQMDQDPTVQLRQAMIDIQAHLAPVLVIIAEVIGIFASWGSENASLLATIIAIVTAVGTIIAVLSVLAPVVTAVTTVAGALGVSIAAVAGPITLAVAAIGLITAALVTAYTQSETFRNGVQEIFEAIKTIIQTVIDVIVAFLQEKLAVIQKFWHENGAQILAAVENAFNGIKAVIGLIMPIIQMIIEDAWNAIKNVIDGAMNIILGIIKTFSSALTGDWQGVWDGIKQILSGVVEALWGILQLGFIGKMFKVIKTFAGDALKVITDLASKMKGKFDEIVSAGQTKFDALKDKILKPVQTARDKVSEVVEEIKGFFSGLTLKLPEIKVPKLPKFTMTGEFSLNPPSVPKLGIQWNAKGAIFTKPTVFSSPNYGLQGFGEAGPEAAIPLNNSVLGTIGQMIAQTMPAGNQAVMVNIEPAPVLLDGQKVAEVTFQSTSQLQRGAANLTALTRGVIL